MIIFHAIFPSLSCVHHVGMEKGTICTFINFQMLAWYTGVETARTSVQTSQTKSIGANGATVITTTYYTTFESGVVSTSSNTVSGKASISTSAGTIVAPQAQPVATRLTQSAAATGVPPTAQKLLTVSGQSGNQPSLVSVSSNAVSLSTVSNAGSTNKQGKLEELAPLTTNVAIPSKVALRWRFRMELTVWVVGYREAEKTLKVSSFAASVLPSGSQHVYMLSRLRRETNFLVDLHFE